MSIQKKSLISTLKTAKKANVASGSMHEADAKGSKVASMRQMHSKNVLHAKNAISAKNTVSAKNISAKNTVSAKNVSAKSAASTRKAL